MPVIAIGSEASGAQEAQEAQDKERKRGGGGLAWLDSESRALALSSEVNGLVVEDELGSGLGRHRTPESLALNRENQRRSRARHRELLDELQGRVRDYERRDAQATLDMQRVAREVAAENAALKALLVAKGVAPDEIDAHLQAARMAVQNQPQGQTLPQMLPQMLPLDVPVPGEMPSRRDIISEPLLRQVHHDPRLEMPYQQQSRNSSISSSSMTPTPSALASASISASILTPVSASATASSRASPIPIAPRPLQCFQPNPYSPAVAISPLSNAVANHRSQHLINRRPELPPVKSQGCCGNRPLPMDLDQPVGVSRPQPGQNPTGFSQQAPNQKPACCLNPQTGQVSTCQPQPKPQQEQPQDPSALDPSNKMRCVEAATILARLRGHPDDNLAWATLGCSDDKECVVRNTDLLQIMDEMT
ncbi:hypothetical protein G7Z17_g1138 [Cylindrodendrum hubeiense]|uniref:BZIP domain-containing protein n=1 Tax=Cylindrodendrum hubeiense TaxID=595255 RepID=A0A9P5HFH4_9HYPO|nr:hypothetical protein G7Z17_g1138 [Cylindrodendrum hubeiense]